MPISRAPSRAIATLAATALLAACAGERPTVTPQQGPAQAVSTDPEINAVSDLLLSPPDEFTAEYSIQPTTADSSATEATVWRSAEMERIRVGEVDFYIGPDGELTCDGAPAACTPGVNDGPISYLNLTHDFWAASTNRRLLTDASRKIGSPKSYPETIAGQPSTCVDIPLAGPTANGTVTYCATDSGVLARYNGADSQITLTDFKSTSDAAEMAPPTSAPTEG